jgi:predicted nucleic acid-binding protein
MPEEIFLDTSGLLALIRIRDQLRPVALREMDQVSAQRSTLVTSELVLTELLGSAARPPLRQAAIQITDSPKSSSHSAVVSAGEEHWAEA